MLVALMIILYLCIGYYVGTRRGLAVQLVHLIGYLITYIVAASQYVNLAKTLHMYVPFPNMTSDTTVHLYDTSLQFKLDHIFYNALAFFIIITIGWIVTRIIARLLNVVSLVPVIKQANAIGGGVLGVVMNLAWLTIILTLLSTIPLPEIQKHFTPSSLPAFVVKNVPIISQQVFHWITSQIHW